MDVAHHPERMNPLLDLILQKYMQASRDSIRGPIALKTDVKHVPKTPQEKHSKSMVDDLKEEEHKLRPTNFDDLTMYSFDVGGEKRLCFTELIRSALKDINVHEIYKRKDNLFIFTSKCTQKQMDELKYHNILPWTSASSNLITKSDAYRLVGALLGNQAPKADLNKRSHISFEVYHECFGGCIGVFDPELYSDFAAACIRCTECNGLFAPHKFVSHNHTSFDEVHTCHWGFDSSRWRSYIMLVEQKASKELIDFWDSMKMKFDSPEHKLKVTNLKPNQDPDFVAYIHSPDHKKAMVSPIESLRNQEARIESVKYESSQGESTSAFRPWVTNTNNRPYQKRTESYRSSHFLFPVKSETTGTRFTSFGTASNNTNSSRAHEAHSHHNHHNHGHSNCSYCPSAPLYTDCQQCKKAAHAGCNSRSGIDRHDMNPRETNCSCVQCKESVSYDMEKTMAHVLRNFTSEDNKLTTSPSELAGFLSKELKRLNISQEEKYHEVSIGNQRLQTELQLVKMESEKKLKDVQDTKYHMEEELENMHRERQKEIAMFTKMQSQLHQSMVDCENLKKQLDFYISQRKSSASKWTPYPTMARQFSDSSEDDAEKPKKSTERSHLSISTKASVENTKRETGTLSPVSKSRRLESHQQSSKDESSDIEVED